METEPYFGTFWAQFCEDYIVQDNQEVLSSKQEIFRKHQAKYLNVLYNKFDACWISLRHGIDVFKKLFLHLAVILASYAATQNGCWL